MRHLFAVMAMISAGVAMAGDPPAVESPAGSLVLDGVAAYVNEHPITGGDVLEAVAPIRRQLAAAYKGEELKARMRKACEEALNVLVERYLIVDVYSRQEQRIPEWAIEQQISEFIHESFKDDTADLMTALAREGRTYDDWKKDMREQVIVAAMRRERVDQYVRISPSRIRDAFDRTPEKYRIPARIHVRTLAVPRGAGGEPEAANRQKLGDALKRIQGGEDFATVAKQVSQGPRAEKGGDWGWIEPRVLRPELAKAVEGLKSSEVSEVIEAGDELYVIKLEGRQEGGQATFQEVQAQIERELRQEEARALYVAWVDRLKKDAVVKVFGMAGFVDAALQ